LPTATGGEAATLTMVGAKEELGYYVPSPLKLSRIGDEVMVAEKDLWCLASVGEALSSSSSPLSTWSRALERRPGRAVCEGE